MTELRPARRTLLATAPAILAATAFTRPAAAASRGLAHARVIAERWSGPRLFDLTVQSEAVAEPATVRLLVPTGWRDRRPGQRWPVLYLLHGAGGNHGDWTADADIQHWPELRQVLVVMPDGGEVGFYSNWYNDGAGGSPRWESFHLDDVRRLLELGYGAGARRTVAGLSMGGFGALLYAASRPGMFRAAASYSGPVHLLHPRWLEAWRMAIAEAPWLRGIWGDSDAQRIVWQAHDPYHLAGRLRHLALYVSCGDGNPGPLDPSGSPADPDEQLVHALNQSLTTRLKHVNADVVTSFYPGTHSWPYWERELHRSLPLLLGQ
jgi:diacylglycerol O-acyltransferase / trehalose O-mycolyltransferase